VYSQTHLSTESKSWKVINANPFLLFLSRSMNVSTFSTIPNWPKNCRIISQTSQEDFVHLLFPVSSGSTAASSSTLYSQELHHRRHQGNTTTIRKKTRRRLEIYVPLVQPVWCPLPCRRVYVVDHFATHQRKRSGQKQQNQNLLI